MRVKCALGLTVFVNFDILQYKMEYCQISVCSLELYRKKDVLGISLSQLIMWIRNGGFSYNEVKFFKPLMKSRDELTSYISLICLKDCSLTSKKLVTERETERSKRKILKWLRKTDRVCSEVKLERLDGIGPSKEFPSSLLQKHLRDSSLNNISTS